MKTIEKNYKKNIEILKENLRRGLSNKQAVDMINKMEDQFITAGLYQEKELGFIQEMRKAVIEHFLHLSINIIK